MAEVLTAFSFKGRSNQYPWDTWFDGQIRRLKKGVDFHVNPKSVAQAIYSKAKEKRFSVQIQMEGGDGIVMQALPCKQD